MTLAGSHKKSIRQHGECLTYSLQILTLQTARSARAPSSQVGESCPPNALRPLPRPLTRRANTSVKIKRSSGCYYPRRYCLQLFRTATAGRACAPQNARSHACALVWILTETVFEKSDSVDIIRVSAGRP